MSLTTVRAFINKLPMATEQPTAPWHARELANRVVEALDVYVEAQGFDLSEDERRKLRNRLFRAGLQAVLLVDYDDRRGREGKRHGQLNIRLLMTTASHLGMTPQELQVAERDPMRVPPDTRGYGHRLEVR